ncbi:hypothetical protein [Paenibacillus sp. FSL E2-0151]|uniref:hypothetical protein n=1 Tax=Paenibacillus sp. FSL E2-0151 TaxID=2921357 RepID=UPI0030EF2A98
MKLQLHQGLPIVSLTVGGTSEICYEQYIPNLHIEHIGLTDFPIQLGSIQEPYGFDGIIGIDFMMRASCKVDFELMNVQFLK